DLDAGLFKATVFLAVDKVTAALGFSLAPLEGTPTPARSAPAATPPDAREPFVFEKAELEFAARKLAWKRAGRVDRAPTEKDIRAILEQRYLPGWTREEVRALVAIWPKEFRGRGPRKRPGETRSRKA
ncbi:MAG TPA: hypothetical protein VGC80_08740, partial [Acetobacteraceae bacterium]